MQIYIIVSLYNEEEHIGVVLKSLSKKKFPIIVVDDGSDDDSYRIASKHIAKSKNHKLIRHKVNLGKGAAMKTGAEAAFKLGADAVIFMDSDGQHLTKDLDGFVKALKSGNGFIVGTRNLSYGVPLFRYTGNKIASLIIVTLFNVYVSDLLCGFRAVTSDAYEKIKWRSRGYGVETEMIVRAAISNVKYKEVPVTVKYHDKHKGVTIFDAVGLLYDVTLWRLETWFSLHK